MKKIIFGLFLLFSIAASVVSAQTPTPTPTPTPEYPNVPNSGHDSCTFYNYGFSCPSIARDDIFIHRIRGTATMFFTLPNDDNATENVLVGQTDYVGHMQEANCQCSYSPSQYQVVVYGDYSTSNQTAPVYGVDFARYYGRSTPAGDGNTFVTNIANITVFAIPNDGAENAGDSCSIGLPAQAVHKPVNPTNGNMWLEETDYVLPGAGEVINLKRFYNSIIQTSGMFGRGWSTPYDESLTAYGDLAIRLDMPDGRAVYLARKTTSEPYTIAAQKFFDKVVKNMDGSYDLQFNDGRTHHFYSNGFLAWQKDRVGNQTSLGYDINWNPTSITDAEGRVLTLTVNTGGLVTAISDATGQIATYAYNTDGTLQSVTYPDSSQYKFEYTNPTTGKIYLTAVKDALNNVLEAHTYDSGGRAITSETDGGTNKYTLAYGVPYNYYTFYTSVTDANNHETKYFFNDGGGQNLVYRVDGDCGCGGSGTESTLYEYDEHYNVKKKTDGLGHQTTYTYDGRGNALTITDVLGTETYTYNSLNEMLSRTDRMGGVTTNTYNTAGNLLTSTDPLSHTTTLTYTTLGQPATIKDALNHTTTLTHNSLGLLTQVKDANNKTTDFVYNARGRITSITNALSEATAFTYDLKDRLNKITLPDTKFISYTYDSAGRRTKTTDARGHDTNYAYDNAYRITSVTDALSHTTSFGYDLMSNPTSQTDALGNVTNFEYDGFNRLKKVIYPMATTGATRLQESMTYDQDGNIKTMTDTAGRVTTYDYDNANRLVQKTDALNEVTQFTYNTRSQKTKVKDALNQEYVFTYDPLGRVLSQTRGGNTMSYQYDAVGNRTKMTDYIGDVTDYTYDVLNRLHTIAYTRIVAIPEYQIPIYDMYPTGDTYSSTYNYDDLSRLASAENETGTVSFTYDNRGRIASSTDVLGHLVEYSYDENGNRTELKLDSTTVTAYAYDNANRLTTLTDEASQDFTFSYDIANRLTSKTLPNGISTSYTYDGMSRLKRLKDQLGTSVLNDNQYTYNSASQIGQIAELSQTKNYTYDNVDRLTAITNGTTSEAYAFDGVGNRSSSHLSATYGYQGFNQLASTSTANYTYDTNGNMLTKSTGSWTYEWNLAHRLVRAKSGGKSVRYLYDALGRRVHQYKDNGKAMEATDFLYDGMDVLADNPDGTMTIYQNGPGIDNKLKMVTGSTASYFLNDHLGSTTALTDDTGAITEQNSYDSFGNATNSTFSTRYQYTGREHDDFTGLQYSRARWYDPKIGRFISEDPIGFAGGDINLYGYVWNSPNGFTDPTGLDGWGEDAADWVDEKIDAVHNTLGFDPTGTIIPLPISLPTISDSVRGMADALRVGGGLGHAIYDEDDNIYGRAANVAMDISRAASIFSALAGPFAGGAQPESCPINGPKLLESGNPISRGNLPGPTVDPATGVPVGRFVIDTSGNAMIEPVGGSTVPRTGGVDTHTLYPNGSNYQRLNPAGHGSNPTPHGHGHLLGTGPSMSGQGASIDVFGNTVPWNSPAAHWPIK